MNLEYLEKERFFAQTQRGLEAIALTELEELGAVQCEAAYCGVYFKAAPKILYKINYCARTVNHVLAPLVSFSCPTEEVLYKKARQFPWSDLFSLDKTFAIKANVSSSKINHSYFATFKLKDAVVDQFRDQFGKRPNVDPVKPDVLLNLNIRDNRAVISLDTSGESLHRRGYRVDTVIAPMQETLAAAIILLSGWKGEQPLIDPMCGAGTLLAEALMIYCNIPSAFKRKTNRFGFVHLPDYDAKVWRKIKGEADAAVRPYAEGLISGSDMDAGAARAARRNLNQIQGGKDITILKKDFRDIEEAKNHMIVTNPPYGIRVGEKQKLFSMYKQMGDFFKQKCTGSKAFVLCGDKELSKQIGLKISRRIPLFNGPLETRLVKIDIY
jgi:23S rRNA (guanine2445-N2)-methyltransferase